VLSLQDGPSLEDLLIDNQREIEVLQLRQATLAAEFAASGRWEKGGYNSSIDWMRFNLHLSKSGAVNYVRVGQQMHRLEKTLAAMDGGEVGYAHLAVMAKTAEAVGRAFDEDKLLQLACESSPGKFYFKCLHYRHAVDARRYCQEQNDQSENHYLKLSTVESGHLLINGVLDPVSGAAVRGVLEPLAQRSGAHDDRKLEVRMADALYEGLTGGKPASLQVTATLETLKGMAGAPAGEMEFSLPISSASVRRMACDSSVTRILLNQESQVIDVGRARRVVDGALRKALAVRDKHCQWPGCERPASWCDGHHILHWIDGGETNLENCVLLCRRHHRMVHEGGWQLIKAAGKIVVIAPTVTFGLPRSPD
jgi:hypothetical protein